MHGEFESVNRIGGIWSECPACIKEAKERKNAEEEKKASEKRNHAWLVMLSMSGIPERFQDRSLQNYEASTEAQRKALEFAKSYAEEFDDVMRTGRSALFVGKPGTGKTHLAAAIGMQVMREQHRTVCFCTVMRAIRRVKDTWAKGSCESESQAIAALAEPDLLILDEVGVQYGSEFEKNILFDVLNERYERRRPSILISNLPAAEAAAYLGERVIDRIREDGGARIVFDWVSYRGAWKARAG
jgi:DNA replication protein DnaC